MIRGVYLFDEAGILVFSYRETTEINPVMLSGFLSALKSFAKTNVVDGDLTGITVGAMYLDLENIEFEHLGNFDVLLITTNLDPGSSHALCSDLAEALALFLDQRYSENNDFINAIRLGCIPDLTGLSAIVDPILENFEKNDVWNIEADLAVPSRIFDLITEIFETQPKIARNYSYNRNLLLEQILIEFIYNELDERLKQRFLRKA